MRKIKLYVLMSLDGYIARPNGELDWITNLPNPQKTDYGYKEFIDSVDTVIIGADIYDATFGTTSDFPYSGKETYIVSNYGFNINLPKNVKYLTGNLIGNIFRLKEKPGKDIWLVSGSQVVTLLLNHDLIDEMQICYIPVVLGEGISLFQKKPKESKWEMTGSTVYDSGILKVDYKASK